MLHYKSLRVQPIQTVFNRFEQRRHSLNQFRLFLLAAILLCIAGAQTAAAQNITVYQGNGQLVCLSCVVLTTPGVNNTFAQQFAPLYVKVTDANGNPVANTTVNWAISGQGQWLPAGSTTTTTDNTGLTHALFFAPNTPGAALEPAQNTVTATTATGNIATFTLTQTTLDNVQTRQMNVDLTCSSLSPPPPAGCTSFGPISGSAGTTGQPIYVGVFASGNSLIGGLTGPVAGVSVRLVNYQTGASVQCATAPGADPGSTLTDSTGYAVCNPILSGAGNGQFAVVVGGSIYDFVNYTPFPQD